MKPHASEALAAFVGLDWADATHDICRPAAGTERREFLNLQPRPEAMNAWGQTLHTRVNGPPGAVCLERKKGPLVSALRHDDVLVLFPVNPLTVATYRAALTPSRANDDPTDAALPVEILLKHRDRLTPLSPPSPTMRALAPLVEHRRRRVGDHVRLTHRVTRARKTDCPPVLPWVQAQDPVLFGAFLSRWPTLKAVPLARRATVAGFFRAHHVRSADVLTPRLEAIQSALALTTDDGVSAPHVRLGHARVAQLRITWQAMADGDTAIAPRAQDHPDCPVFDAVPGAGAVLAPRLRVAFGEPRARLTAADARPTYAGLAPVTERRGQKSWVHWRRQCPTCLRHTLVEWAAESTRHACWAQVYSQQQRDQGKAHQAAVRALACTWIRLL
jgi:transposase